MTKVDPRPGTAAGSRIMSGTLRRARAFAHRLMANEDGINMIEFGLLATPFLALMFWIINTTLMFFAQQALQTATDQAARLVMTGQAQAEGLSANQFQALVCADATSLFKCSAIYVNIQTFSSFSAIAPNSATNNGAFTSSNLSYSLGTSGDIEVVQVYYQWPLFANLMGSLSNVSGNNRLLVATSAFRNEPF